MRSLARLLAIADHAEPIANLRASGITPLMDMNE
jgi:hypothetical protein